MTAPAAEGAGTVQDLGVPTFGEGLPSPFPTSEVRGTTERAPLGKRGPNSFGQSAK